MITRLSKSLIKDFSFPGRPIPQLWIPKKIDTDNLPPIDDPEIAVRAIRFFQDMMLIHEGPLDGKPFTLVSWMWLAVWQIEGRRDPDGFRTIREVFICPPKKQAKSPFAGAYAVKICGYDNPPEPGAKVAVVAASRDQAGYIYKPIVYSVRNHPELRQRFKVFASENRIEYYKPVDGDWRIQGELFRRTGDAKGKQGGNWSGLFMDEIGDWPAGRDRELWDTYTAHSQTHRRQPLLMTTTTANVYRQDSVYQEQRAKAIKKINDPERFPRYLPIAFFPTPEEEKQLRNRIFPSAELVKRLNPAHDEVIPLKTIMEELKDAIDDPGPTKWPNALRYKLNVDISSIFQWMPPPLWKSCDFGPINPDDLHRYTWHVGVDLAPVDDLSSVIFLAEPKEPWEKVKIVVYAYVPQEAVDIAEGRKQKIDKDGNVAPVHTDTADYSEWAKNGHLRIIEGSVLDDSVVVQDIKDFFAHRDADGKLDRFCGVIAYDPAHSKQCRAGLEDWYGDNLLPYPNNYANYHAPCRDIMHHAKAGMLSHGNHPALSHHMMALMMKNHEDGSYKPIKRSEGERNDIACAFLLAWLAFYWSRGKSYTIPPVVSVEDSEAA